MQHPGRSERECYSCSFGTRAFTNRSALPAIHALRASWDRMHQLTRTTTSNCFASSFKSLTSYPRHLGWLEPLHFLERPHSAQFQLHSQSSIYDFLLASSVSKQESGGGQDGPRQHHCYCAQTVVDGEYFGARTPSWYSLAMSSTVDCPLVGVLQEPHRPSIAQQ